MIKYSKNNSYTNMTSERTDPCANRTWSWHRRSGMVGLDPILIVKLIAIAAGNLANVFFCVIFFTCLYWFVFYKEQNFLHAMLPSEDQEKIIKDYVISIFSLKVSIIPSQRNHNFTVNVQFSISSIYDLLFVYQIRLSIFGLSCLPNESWVRLM